MEEPVLGQGAVTCTPQIDVRPFQRFFDARFKWARLIWPSCQNYSNYLSNSSLETRLLYNINLILFLHDNLQFGLLLQLHKIYLVL